MWQVPNLLKRARRLLGGAVSTAAGQYREYSASLPEGFGAQRITMRLTTPRLPVRPVFSFSEHVMDEQGRPTDTILAVAKGGFAISRDLGRRWKQVKIKGRERQYFEHVKSIGHSEFLVQTSPEKEAKKNKSHVDLLVVTEDGEVLVEHLSQSYRWHGCRAVDWADGTLMYAEYPSNRPVNGKRPSSARVFRSRDRGRNWEVVFEQSGAQIRHFHFLQARQGFAGEWWLTSGDYPHESHVWVSKDDGDSWTDLTAGLSLKFEVNGTVYERDSLRLTDLVWLGDEVVWGSDDDLATTNPPGACVFRSKVGLNLAPQFVGRGMWHFRSIVDIGDYFVLISQRSNRRGATVDERRPGVYLMRKQCETGHDAFVHLFDLDTFPSEARMAGFTFSKASRMAKNNVFFSYRSDEDVFDGGPKVLEWRVRLE